MNNLTAQRSLPLPTLLANEVCRLRLADFVINPYTVSGESIQHGTYSATVISTGERVRLTISSEATGSFQTRPDLLTRFVDRGIQASVYKESVSLQEVMEAHTRVGRPLTLPFMWQVVKAIGQHFLSQPSHPLPALDSSSIRLSDMKIYVVCPARLPPSARMPADPLWPAQVNQSGVVNPTNWEAYRDSLSCIGTILQEMMEVNQSIAARQHRPQTRLLRGRGITRATDHRNSTTKQHTGQRDIESAAALSSLLLRCRSQNLPRDRRAVREIVQMSRKNLGEVSRFPSIHENNKVSKKTSK
ncbi:uncharacterized protein LOC101858042 isoform X2 [Aplysia californica]|uniref:Uncharacterized protein LOC101858042 isoform X2 n=1 Tax=Aplysia californica TaxID=6500 RepID=A0ABM0JUV8_APLCA|nr:uncharacterized protein LOC101858042 isoform X2 [Aplysia californica]